MKRKKWSEAEEKTLLTKYLELLNSGSLAKLNTREKKFKPIAEHVNSVHHLRDSLSFPFKWSWRDLSIKVQNMRHQYLGVKQKIQISNDDFNWNDAENHWDNFLLYKKVFGDVDLSESKSQIHNINRDEMFKDEGFMGLGYGMSSKQIEDESEGKEDEEEKMSGDDVGVSEGEFGGDKGEKHGNEGKRLRMVGEQLSELRGMMVRREEKRRGREWIREEKAIAIDHCRKEREFIKEIHDSKRYEELEARDIEFEDRQIMWAKKEYERRVRLEKEFDEEKRRRMKLEEEEMQWREMMVGIQTEHEKQMMQLHMDACQNQMHVLGSITRMWYQFCGSMNDGLAGGLGTLPPQVMHEAGNLGGNEKPDTNSPSPFL